MQDVIQIKTIADKFSDLIFEPITHTYRVKGKLYPSVSKLVEAHAPKFDANFMAPLSAKKDRVTEQEIHTKWNTIRDVACVLGTNTHDFLEGYNGLQYPRNGHEEAGIKFIGDMGRDYNILFRELRMYSGRWGYAGTEDLILIHKTTGDIVAADYKTNADLFKCYKGQTLLMPFDYLECTPYNKYQLQLSYYDIMLSEAGFNVTDRLLVYLKADGTYKLFSTLDLKSELIQHMRDGGTQPKFLW